MPTPPPQHPPAPSPPLWTLPDLSARVAVALATADLSQDSGRVRDIPNARTIRYYTTIGLLDRPLSFDGRTALYGPRHLLQLLAIKHLQSQHLTLEQIQHRLLGITDAALCAISHYTPSHSDLTSSPPTPPPAPSPASKEAFWLREPAPIGDVEPAPSPPQKLARYPALLRALSLHPDVSLVLSPHSSPLTHQDMEAIEAAAAPLLRLLEARKLIQRSEEIS
jgi:hypothetical protein